jgi:L-ascorbate metabolism protein UlaG (beta-lactamase superfamily)
VSIALLASVASMQISHLGHACLLVETAQIRLLIDPGNYSAGFESLTDLDAVLVTHQHADHFDPDRAPRLVAANPVATLLVEPETVAAFGMSGDAVFAAGSELQIGDVTITAVGGRHATNHDRIPPLGNVGFVVAAAGGLRLFHPGDSYADAPAGVDVLALPLNAPWTRVSETLEFARAVDPGFVVPIHDGLLGSAGRAAYLMHVSNFGPEDAELVDLSGGASRTFV